MESAAWCCFTSAAGVVCRDSPPPGHQCWYHRELCLTAAPMKSNRAAYKCLLGSDLASTLQSGHAHALQVLLDQLQAWSIVLPLTWPT